MPKNHVFLCIHETCQHKNVSNMLIFLALDSEPAQDPVPNVRIRIPIRTQASGSGSDWKFRICNTAYKELSMKPDQTEEASFLFEMGLKNSLLKLQEFVTYWTGQQY
jgi:hypothetical protein